MDSPIPGAKNALQIMSLVAYANKTKKELSFDDLAGPLKKNFDPATRPAKQIIRLRTQNIKTVYTSRL